MFIKKNCYLFIAIFVINYKNDSVNNYFACLPEISSLGTLYAAIYFAVALKFISPVSSKRLFIPQFFLLL